MNKSIVFVHVEKAGGITIHNMLHHFIDGYVSPRPNYGTVFTQSHLKLLQRYYPVKIKGIGGHRISSSELYFDNQFVFSFIRDPLKRLLSHLNWQIHKLKINHTFDSFVENPYFQNFQTYRLTGERDFDRAKVIIDNNFDFIGLTEKFDLSINLISKILFGDYQYLSYEFMNVSKPGNVKYTIDKLQNNEIEKMIKLNDVDIKVYQYIKDKFNAEYQHLGDIVNLETSSLKTGSKSKLKRKFSNAYIGRIVQPMMQKRVETGY